MKPETTTLRFGRQSEKIAERLFEAVYRHKAARPTFFSLMMFKIQQWSWQRAVSQDTIDYQYWKNQGWFEPNRTFYIPHESSPAKVAVARLIGGIITHFVTE